MGKYWKHPAGQAASMKSTLKPQMLHDPLSIPSTLCLYRPITFLIAFCAAQFQLKAIIPLTLYASIHKSKIPHLFYIGKS